ncbi:MAG: type II secretory pathway predicted ATPase ExeA [Kiritimatiellia bacterium]|jgi:type II secretory pathway predicted ATPase ExeA
MQGLHAALSGSEAFVKFIGQARTGKSGVCEKLAQFMRLKDYRVIYFDYPVESPDMLHSMLTKELDIPGSFNILRHLEDALAEQTDKPLVLIFDDAHLLSDITLIEIYRLASVQIEQKRVINIALCGEPELERRLSKKKEFNPLLQHVSHNFLLEPMNAATTSRFLSAYLEKTELAGLHLEPAALNQFTKSCKGFPGPAYSLCQLVFASRQDNIEQSPLTKEELLLAIRSANGEQPVSSSLLREGNRWMLFSPIAAVIVIASLALLVRQLNPPELRSEIEEVASTGSIATSPFALNEGSVAIADSPTSTSSLAQVESVSGSAQVAVISPELQVDEPNEERLVSEEELPVSDSTLALVTAQERGISNETITEPLLEPMASGSDPVQFANVTLTRPMLALDDDEIQIMPELVPEIAPEIVAQTPIVEAELLAQQNIVETVSEVEPLQSVSIESLPSESVAQQSAPLSPQQVVQVWLEAWEGQDLEQYFASYDDDFVPRYHRSKSAWQSNRERVIGNASQISLEMSDFVLISEDAETMEVHFWLAYSSPSYRDDTRKKLILKKLPASDRSGARLVILEEINLEVRV